MIVLPVIISLLVSLIILFLSGDRVVEYGKKFALAMGVSSFVFGLLVVALGTSLPEIVVSIVSALSGYPEVVVGDILGSNIADLFLLIAVYSFLVRWFIEEDFALYLVSAVSFTGIAFVYTLIRGELGIIDGILLILLFFLFVRSRLPVIEMEEEARIDLPNDLFVFFLSLLALAISSYTAVKSVILLSHLLNLSPFVVSAITLAFGTSLPELSIGINAIRRGEQYMALGDVVGSLTVNTTLGLGIPSLFINIPVFLPEERFTIFLLLFGLFVFIYQISRRRVLDEKTSMIFLFLYLVFLIGILL